MIKINWGQNDNQEFSGRNVRGFEFVCFANHLTVNTPYTANPVDLSKIQFKCTYNCADKSIHNIVNSPLLPIVSDSGFMDASFQQNLQIGTFVAPVYIVAAGGVDEVLLLSSAITLPNVLTVDGNEMMELDLQVPNGAAAATMDTSASTFYYDLVEGIGMSPSVPQIKTVSVRASVDTYKADLGDDVISATWINSDKAGIISANQVILNCNFQSDKLNFSDDFFELRAKRDKQFVSLVESNARNQCFRLFDMASNNYSGMPVRLMGANLDFTLNSANVVASRNWVVSKKYLNNTYVYQRATAKFPKHLKENQNAAIV